MMQRLSISLWSIGTKRDRMNNDHEKRIRRIELHQYAQEAVMALITGMLLIIMGALI